MRVYARAFLFLCLCYASAGSRYSGRISDHRDEGVIESHTAFSRSDDRSPAVGTHRGYVISPPAQISTFFTDSNEHSDTDNQRITPALNISECEPAQPSVPSADAAFANERVPQDVIFDSPRSTLNLYENLSKYVHQRDYKSIVSLLETNELSKKVSDIISNDYPHVCGVVGYHLAAWTERMANEPPLYVKEALRCLDVCCKAWHSRHVSSQPITNGTGVFSPVPGMGMYVDEDNSLRRPYQMVRSVFERHVGFGRAPNMRVKSFADSCSICLESLVDADSAENLLVLPCGHVTCFDCGKNWIDNRAICPTCRSPAQTCLYAVLDHIRKERSEFFLPPHASMISLMTEEQRAEAASLRGQHNLQSFERMQEFHASIPTILQHILQHIRQNRHAGDIPMGSISLSFEFDGQRGHVMLYVSDTADSVRGGIPESRDTQSRSPFQDDDAR